MRGSGWAYAVADARAMPELMLVSARHSIVDPKLNDVHLLKQQQHRRWERKPHAVH